MTYLVDTNVLVYRYDPRFPEKQEVARGLLKDAVGTPRLVLPHQALVEFVAVSTRRRADLGGESLLSRAQMHEATQSLLRNHPVIYPDANVLETALSAVSLYGLSWYDAHLWAYAQVSGIPEILSEDFEHGRHYGSVRVVDPFLVAADEVHELPAMYEDDSAG